MKIFEEFAASSFELQIVEDRVTPLLSSPLLSLGRLPVLRARGSTNNEKWGLNI